MKRFTALLLAGTLLFAACDQFDSGPKKVVVDEGVCNDVQFLRLTLGETNRIVLDNSNHSPEQGGIVLRLVDFPILIRGELPPGTTVGSQFTTTAIEAAPGEEASIDVEPTFAGEFRAECNVTLVQPDSQANYQRTILFQITN